MVIDLTTSEKQTFFRFLFLYLGSSFVLMLLIAFLYFQNEKTLYVDLVKSNMQNKVSAISSNIVYAHMTSSLFDRQKALDDSEYKLSFYNENQKKLFGNLNENIDFTKKVIHKDNYIVLVDDSTLGHLGVYYIAIKEHVLHNKIEKLLTSIIMMFISVYFFVAIVGYYLAKLFLKPIKEERQKLNNFIKDTTHELNTPISAIIMSSQNNDLGPKQVQRIKLSANRISEIYKDLSYVFLENKDIKKQVLQYDLKQMIQKCLDNFEPLIEKKRIKISLDIQSFKYKIDKDDFERLFNNLLSNAIKYNKMNGTIDISLNDRKLIVKDGGIGIARERLDDIYKRYFRATNQSGGFGLGLNIVDIVCKTYNIKIEVDSIENRYTKFTLTF